MSSSTITEPGPLSAHAAVSTRHPGDELALARAEREEPTLGAADTAGKVADKEEPELEMLSLWIGLGLIAAVAVGLFVSQCR